MPHDDPRVARLIELRSLHCPTCAYDLRGMQGSCCPECGVDLPLCAFQHPDVRPGQARRVLFVVGTTLSSLAFAGLLLASLVSEGHFGNPSFMIACGLLLGLHGTYAARAIFWARSIWDRPGVLWPLWMGSIFFGLLAGAALLLG